MLGNHDGNFERTFKFSVADTWFMAKARLPVPGECPTLAA